MLCRIFWRAAITRPGLKFPASSERRQTRVRGAVSTVGCSKKKWLGNGLIPRGGFSSTRSSVRLVPVIIYNWGKVFCDDGKGVTKYFWKRLLTRKTGNEGTRTGRGSCFPWPENSDQGHPARKSDFIFSQALPIDARGRVGISCSFLG